MDLFSELIPIVTLVLTVFNLIFLLAIAASVSKLLQYLSEERKEVSRETEELQGPNYVDQTILAGQGEPYSDGVAERSSQNWDGVSSPQE